MVVRGRPVANPDADRLLITADAGGSNGYRTRLWKVELAELAAGIGIEITVCPFPPGTSKWNKGGTPPVLGHLDELAGPAAHQPPGHRGADRQHTTSRTELKVRARLDQGYYPTGIKVTDKELAALPITRHKFHGDWNYTLEPRGDMNNNHVVSFRAPG
ncbi:MAG: hypothetical protein GEV08_05375 [Acidimicrobiia bacterium]|nr:hypothetical protein [Acidimicrobiia bacterium]